MQDIPIILHDRGYFPHINNTLSLQIFHHCLGVIRANAQVIEDLSH